MEYFIKLIKKKYKTDISKDARALQKLRREAERAKRALSSQHQVGVAGRCVRVVFCWGGLEYAWLSCSEQCAQVWRANCALSGSGIARVYCPVYS
jgi:hypothetical protein